jgi:putative ABC transport system permease protein
MVVTTMPRITLDPAPSRARMLGIDTEKFPDVALWRDDFASEPLDELMARLDEGSPTAPNVLVVGGNIAEDAMISVAGDDIPINVVGRLEAFPGMANEGPTIVMNDASFDETASHMSIYSQPSLWVKGDPDAIEATLRASSANIAPPRTVDQVLQAPAIQSALGILGVLTALGAAAGIIVVIGLLLYLQARHRSSVVSSALTRRMGLGRSAEFRAWFWEIAGALIASFAAAVAIALPVASLMNTRLDPRPDLAPGPSLLIPSVLVVLIGVTVVLIAGISAWRIQRSIDRTDIAQEMRT